MPFTRSLPLSCLFGCPVSCDSAGTHRSLFGRILAPSVCDLTITVYPLRAALKLATMPLSPLSPQIIQCLLQSEALRLSDLLSLRATSKEVNAELTGKLPSYLDFRLRRCETDTPDEQALDEVPPQHADFAAFLFPAEWTSG